MIGRSGAGRRLGVVGVGEPVLSVVVEVAGAGVDGLGRGAV